MDALLFFGLSPIGKVKVFDVSNTLEQPVDEGNRVFLTLLLSGVGFLLPYNSLITAVDYFHAVFPGTTIVFDISLIYILTSLIAVLLSNVIIHTFSLNSRIMFGYFLSCFILLFIMIFIMLPSMFSVEERYVCVLLCVALLSLGTTGTICSCSHQTKSTCQR